MKAKLIINDKEFEVEISDEQVQALTETKKKTGYERVEKGECYYMSSINGSTDSNNEVNDKVDEYIYENADYYSDRTVAENNARADKLYRKLRRFAVEHRREKLDWNGSNQHFFIYYNHDAQELKCSFFATIHEYGTIKFDNKETAQLAIDTFKDELLWYFTEYKDSL